MSKINSNEMVNSTYDQMVNWRRYLHAHPELSFKEYETAAYITAELKKLDGIEVSHPTETSVVGRLKGKKGTGKTIAIRGDIDALPITEATGLPFASKTDGVMHACGHDGHTSILLATATVLHHMQEELTGEFVFLFQHAEETPPGGARELVEAGVLDGVDYVIGGHLWSTVPFGEIQITEGPVSAASDVFDIEVTGKSGHASQPDTAVDALAIGSQIITNLQHIISRSVGPFENAVVSVTKFHSGNAYNVIPDKAYIGGSVRTLSEEVREHIKQKMEQIASNVANAHNAKATVSYEYGYDSTVNDEALTEMIFDNAAEQFKDDEEIEVVKAHPMMTGEDFSALSNEVPGCYAGIGAMKKKNGQVIPHHHPEFDIEEKAMLVALKYYVSTALHIAGNKTL